MVFYQATLLVGYAYAHWAVLKLRLKRQIAVHLVIMGLPFLFLPIAVAKGFVPPTGTNPIPWLIALLCASVGLPFFTISANTSMLQKWFANTDDPRSRDPYFLYQASNLGSMLALICFPALAEPFLHLASQRRLWTCVYVLLFLSTLGCAAAAWRSPRPAAAKAEAPPLRLAQRLRWLALAFVPSSLMLAATAYLTSCISPVPLLWVIPLGIYLLSFVITFSRRPILSRSAMLRLQPLVLLPLVFLMMTDAARPAWAIIPLHLIVFFVTAVACHGELAESRPPVENLTEFYLWIAIGGACGGFFEAILGPLLFKSIAEYPISLVIACLLRPAGPGSERPVWGDIGFPTFIGGITIALSLVSQKLRIDLKPLFALPVISCLAFKDRPLRFGLGIGATLMFCLPYAAELGRPIHVERSFFGVHRVLLDPDRKFHWLTNGSLAHGVQSLEQGGSLEPLLYYNREGPLGQLFALYGASLNKQAIAVIGLGTGSIACYGSLDQRWTYYEIDPAVERIARDPRYFTFLADCSAKAAVVLGDARLALAKVQDGSYQWIILDAFNSDTIPMHLLTQEAIGLYMSKLADHGFLIFHISNGYLDLKPVVGDLARSAGLTAFVQEYAVDKIEAKEGKASSTWAVLSRDSRDLHALADDPRWTTIAGSGKAAWSDDFSSIIRIIDWK